MGVIYQVLEYYNLKLSIYFNSGTTNIQAKNFQENINTDFQCYMYAIKKRYKNCNSIKCTFARWIPKQSRESNLFRDSDQ